MKQKLLTTTAACLCAIAISASAVVAAPGLHLNRGAGSLKPDKNAEQHDRGKHLGQAKHDQATKPDRSDSEEVNADHERKQNHGWFVSQVARDHTLTGKDHDKAVSEAARGSSGKPAKSKP